MISTVTVKQGKKAHKLKVSIQAQVRLEKDLGRNITSILEDLLSGDGGVTLVLAWWAACLDDGAGVDEAAAMSLLDDLGGVQAGAPYLTEALQAAFPFLKPADDEPDGGEGSGAGDEGNGEAA